MKLTVEYLKNSKSTGEVMIICDAVGLDSLIEHLQILKQNRGHVHLMTPSWAGAELTENKQLPNSDLINHLCVSLLS